MKIKLNNKKPLYFILILLFTVIISGTFAYYYSEVAIANQFKTATYNVTVEEEFNGDWGTKKVFFVNKEETNTPVVLRINYNELWVKEIDGETLTLDNNVNGVNVVDKNWTTQFTNNFIQAEDGWYYYNKVLGPKESVQVLESISLNDQLISLSPYYEEYKKYNYELSFNFEAIQASEQAVLDIWNKNVVINGDDALWKS